MGTSAALSTSNQYVKYTISISQNSQDKVNNQSNVTVSVRFYRTNTGYTTYGSGTVYCKINGTTYSAAVTPSQKITNSGIVLFTKTLNIKHGSDGKKTLTCSAWISHNAPLSSSEQSYSQVLTTIPRASTLTASNGTLGTAQNLAINRADNSFTHTITYKCGTASGTIATKATGTSVSFTPPLSLSSQNTKGTAVNIIFTITTYSGNTAIGTATKSISCTIPNSVVPTISSVDVTEAASIVPDGFPFVQHKSQFRVEVTASGTYGSTITSKVIVEDASYSGTNITTNTITASGTVNVVVTVTDSRGRTATTTKAVSVLGYSDPTVSCSAVRCNSDGTENEEGAYMKISYKLSITSLNNKNSTKYLINYKKSADTSYTTVPIPTAAYSVNAVQLIAADTGSSYDVVVSAQDSFAKVEKGLNVSTAFTIFNIRGNGKGFAFFKVSEKDGMEIDDDVYIKGGATMFNPTFVANGTDLDELRTAGWYSQNANAQTTNMLNIPVNVAFIMGVIPINSAMVMQIFIPYNANGIYKRYYQTWDPIGFTEWQLVSGKSQILSTTEDDNYICKKYTDGTMEISGRASYSSLACNTALGNWFRTDVKSPPNYPQEFSEPPAVTMNFDTNSGSGALVWQTTASSVSKPPDFYLIRPTSSTAVSGTVSIIATGRWE